MLKDDVGSGGLEVDLFFFPACDWTADGRKITLRQRLDLGNGEYGRLAAIRGDHACFNPFKPGYNVVIMLQILVDFRDPRKSAEKRA